MLGIIVQLALSWLLVWWFEKGNLNLMGFYPAPRRLLDFTLFFIVTAACCASGFLLQMAFAGQRWQLNPQLSITLILQGVWWNIKSVLFEELIFRGVLLYILIKKLGSIKGIGITAAAFGMYHWFSQNLFGNAMQMTIVFIITGCMGAVLGYAYYKTKSLYIPIAIHLGWGIMQQTVFSSGPIGRQLLVQVTPGPAIYQSYLTYFAALLLPVMSTLLMNYWLLRKRAGVAW
jgi:uncharacterized protein